MKVSNWEKKAANSPTNWHPTEGGRRAWICFEDDKTYDLGQDPTGARFKKISKMMLSGNYYPRDVIRLSGNFKTENREMQIGDRLFQKAPLLLRLGGPWLKSAVEIYVASQTPNECEIGYVTTQMHHGRGIWNAILTHENNRLTLRVKSTASPNSPLFWLGLPLARTMQLRARRRAVEEFLKV